MMPLINKIPAIGLGTWDLKGEGCIRAVKSALEIGYRHIDTAEMYENEAEIGKAISGFERKKLFITSKVMPKNLRYTDIIRSCNNSLDKLNTEYLDLYLIHWPSPEIPLKESIKAFKDLYEMGKIKNFGVSNFSIDLLEEAINISKSLNLKIATNQVEFHPFLYQKALLDFCNKNNIAITAYCPIARGHVLDNKTLIEIGKRHNKTAAQVSLRWLIQKGIIVIPKASSIRHLKENIDIFGIELSKEEVAKIDNIKERIRIVG